MPRSYQLTERQRQIVHGALIYAETFLDDLSNLRGISHIEEEEIKAMKACFDLPIDEDLQPLWRQEPFTEEDRQNMMELMMDEIRDTVKEKAQETFDSIEDPAELVSYVDDDPEVTAEFLQLVEDGDDVSDTDQRVLDFAYRFDLVTTVPTRACGDDFTYALTALGRKYLTEYK